MINLKHVHEGRRALRQFGLDITDTAISDSDFRFDIAGWDRRIHGMWANGFRFKYRDYVSERYKEPSLAFRDLIRRILADQSKWESVAERKDLEGAS